MRALKIQSKNRFNMKIVANYFNFVFHIEVNTKSKHKILNFVKTKNGTSDTRISNVVQRAKTFLGKKTRTLLQFFAFASNTVAKLEVKA